MTGVDDLIRIFADKLHKTGSLDDALRKAVWKAYLAGYAEGVRATTHQETPSIPKWVMLDKETEK